jgi:PAS domain S-box-containing protein
MNGSASGQGDMRELMLALKRARDDADRRTLETTAILEVLETLLRPLPPARMVLRVLRVLRRILPFEDAVVLEPDGPGQLRVAFATEAGRLGTHWPDGPVFDRARAGEVVNLVDIARVPDFASAANPMLCRPGGALAIALPIGANEGRAPLVLLRSAERGGFTAEMARTVRRLTVVARQALASLEARRLREQATSLAAEKDAYEVAWQESERREAMVRGILEAIPVGIYLKDEKGRFGYVNGTAERILARPKAELLGRLPSEVLPPDIGAGKEADDRALLSGKVAGPLRREMTLGTAEDPTLVEINKAAVMLDGRRRVVATLQDVTLRRAAERAMLAAKNAAEAANRAKSDFVATVSHEIRTPLNGILGMTQALLAQPRSTADRRALGLILSSGDMLLGLIDNILNQAKIEAGKLDLLPAETDLASAVHQVAAFWTERAHAKGLDLVRIMDGRMPTRARLDPLRLAQVLNNLVGNAVKFTARGGIVLRLCVETLAEGEKVLDLAVEDTGPGIPPQERHRLFRRFSQIEAADGRGRPGGTGLGLSICQDVVRLMGGEITHEDRPGGGSIFRVRVPLDVLDPAPRFGLPLAGRYVLVAPGADARRRQIVADQLRSMGADLRDTSATAPDLVICTDPNDFARLRAMADTAAQVVLDAVPKVLLGAPGAARLPAPCQHVPLPLSPAALYDAVEDCLGLRPPHPPLLDDMAGLPDGAAPRHRRGALVLLVEDHDVNRAVARALLEGLGLEIMVAENGQEALAEAARRRPELVLMDLHMPVMDGLEATRRLRAAGFDMPIAACTANILPDALAGILKAGASHVLRKPIDRAELQNLLAETLPATATPQPAAETLLRASVLTELIDAIGPEAVREAAALLRQCAVAQTAATRTALATGDLAAANRHAHALTSPAAMLGADALSQAMARIERAARVGDSAAAMAAAEGLETLLEQSLASLDRALAAAS